MINVCQRGMFRPTKPFFYFLTVTAALLFSTFCFAQTDTSLFVPIILSSSGENGSFFTSELTLTNRGKTNVTLDYRYTAAFGGGSGQASDSLTAGQQRIIPDTIAYLSSLGVPVPESGDRGGTLSVLVHNLASPLDIAITVRTTTTEHEGRAGMAYAAVRPEEFLVDPAYLFGLRQNASDRSNVAVENVGSADQGDITLRLMVLSGDPSQPRQQTLPDITLTPGGWSQLSEILHSNGLSLDNGYVRIYRVQGTAPYYAYAVIHDQANSDSSFIQPVPQNALTPQRYWTLPVIVETSSYSSELIISNVGSTATFIVLSDRQSGFSLTEIQPGEQVIMPDLIQYLRDHGIPNAGMPGQPFAKTLTVSACIDADCVEFPSGMFIAVRTSKVGGEGRFGVFYNAVRFGDSSTGDVWLYDLQQDDRNRTNLALVNTGEMDEGSDTFRIDLFNGNTGAILNTIDSVTVESSQWRQFGNILAQSGLQTTQGYARITQTSGSNPFIAYAVINDGGQPGTGTGDGAFIKSSKSVYQPYLSIAPSPHVDGFCWQEVHWILQLSNAPPNTPIVLVSGPNGIPSGFELPKGAKTDYQGNYSTTGPVGGAIDTYKLAVIVGVLVSNTVNVQIVGDCM